jgi:hypothetical protein
LFVIINVANLFPKRFKLTYLVLLPSDPVDYVKTTTGFESQGLKSSLLIVHYHYQVHIKVRQNPLHDYGEVVIFNKYQTQKNEI